MKQKKVTLIAMGLLAVLIVLVLSIVMTGCSNDEYTELMPQNTAAQMVTPAVVVEEKTGLNQKTALDTPVQPRSLPTQIPPTAILTPTSTLTPTIVPLPDITTSLGQLQVSEIQLRNQDIFSDQAPAGCQFLVVWLEPADNHKVDLNYYQQFKGVSVGVYISMEDGSDKVYPGTGFWNERLFLRFTIPTTMHNYVLFWPDNPAIALGK